MLFIEERSQAREMNHLPQDPREARARQPNFLDINSIYFQKVADIHRALGRCQALCCIVLAEVSFVITLCTEKETKA